MVDENAKRFTPEEIKRDNEEIHDIIGMTFLNMRINAELRGKTFEGENIVVGLLNVVAILITDHPDEEYQLKLMKDAPKVLEIAYERCKKVGRGPPH